MSISKLRFGLQKTSLVDYPGRVACVAFLPGCPFACPYCHNPELARGELSDDLLSWSGVLEHLEKRKGVLSGIVLSGGEPSIYPELPDLVHECQGMGYAVKVDTNGWNPGLFSSCRPDYFALDFKTSPERYQELWATSSPATSSPATSNPAMGSSATDPASIILESIKALRESGVEYELRVTCAPGFITATDARKMAAVLKPADSIILQPYRPGRVLDEAWAGRVSPYTDSQMTEILSVFIQNGLNARIRG